MTQWGEGALTGDALAKQRIRERMWTRLDRTGVTRPPGSHGRIPNFVGAERAAELLVAAPQWQRARVLKANPDPAQLPVRIAALRAGKTVYMAVPNLTSTKPFYLLDPGQLRTPPEQAAQWQVAEGFAVKVGPADMPPIDLIVSGTVAVNAAGTRIGKGAGYADLENALLYENGLILRETIIATTVHELQVVSEQLPETAHDFSVDLIVTPERRIQCGPARRRTGLLWEQLGASKIGTIPFLAEHPKHTVLGG